MKLSLIVLLSMVFTITMFPLGYSSRQVSASNPALFSMMTGSTGLGISENINLASASSSTNGHWLELEGNGVPDRSNWAIFTVTATTFFPPIPGMQLGFSGSFAGLDLTTSSIRVSLLLTYLSSVVKLYYLIGAPTLPSNTGSFRFYGVNVPANGTSFSAQRDIVQDLNTVGAQVDSNWELRSISFGFITYPPVSNMSNSFLVRFNQSDTKLTFSGNHVESSFTSSFMIVYYGIPVLLLSVMLIYMSNEDIRKVGQFLTRSFKRQAREKS